MSETLQPFEIEREALAERLKLKSQWENQVKVLNTTGVLEILTESNDIGVVGIDGKEYPIPKYEEILEKISAENLELLAKKVEQGFSQLLLVPMAVPLELLINRYKKEILRKHREGKLLATDKSKLELDEQTPVWVWNEYKNADIEGGLIYYPWEFSQNHQGKTKSQLIQEGRPWQILLLEDLPDLPAQGQGQTIAERPQLEANHSAQEYLTTLQTNPNY